MHSPEKILLISWDPRLSLTRRLILGAFFEVTTVARAVEAKLLLDRHHFDLIIVCSTISANEFEKIVGILHASPQRIKLMRLGVEANVLEGLDCVCIEHEDGPLCLLRASAQLLGFELRGRGRMVRATTPRMPTKSHALTY